MIRRNLLRIGLALTALALVSVLVVVPGAQDYPKEKSQIKTPEAAVPMMGNQYLISFAHEVKSCDKVRTDLHAAMMKGQSTTSMKSESTNPSKTGGYGRTDESMGATNKPMEGTMDQGSKTKTSHADMVNWRWGCTPDSKTSFLIVNAASEQEARNLIPKSMQKNLQVVRLTNFTESSMGYNEVTPFGTR